MSVAIVIPTFNNLETLKCSLSSLEKQTVSFFKVYICVDGSNDGTFEYLASYKASFPFEVLSHPNKENRGRQATRNLALEKITEEFILFLDSDVCVKSDWIEQHLKALGNHEICIGNVHFTNVENPWVDYYNTRGFNSENSSRTIPVHFYISANASFRKSVFEKVRLMNMKIRTYGADAAFALCLKSLGFTSIYFNAEAVAEGIEQKTVRDAVNQYFEFGSELLPELARNYPDEKNIFQMNRLKKILPFYVIDLNLNYWAEIVGQLKSGIFSRFCIRILLTMALLQGIRKSNVLYP